MTVQLCLNMHLTDEHPGVRGTVLINQHHGTVYRPWDIMHPWPHMMRAKHTAERFVQRAVQKIPMTKQQQQFCERFKA